MTAKCFFVRGGVPAENAHTDSTGTNNMGRILGIVPNYSLIVLMEESCQTRFQDAMC